MQLNEAQRSAIEQSGGPALVLAGAGSGKTRVIVERLAWLIGEQGVDPRHILALTFTNKAAAEMRERMAERLGRERVGAWLGTFHSFGLYLLRREIDRLGRPKNFTVFDDTDQLGLVKRIVRGMSQPSAKVSPREALSWISRFKQDLATPTEEDATTAEEQAYLQIWQAYHQALFDASAVDFDDLLVLPVKLLAEHEDIRGRYQHRYQYIHVDEYQDTNRAQYELARLLSESHGNLFVVGDEDQSIYSWRGATIRNILDFERDFPEARVFRLEQNYRSTKAILEAANAIVANNTQRLGKTLWTAIEGGGAVQLYEAADGEDEAQFVAGAVSKPSIDPRQAAVLYRTNAQARQIEEALRLHNVAYVVLGGIKFYARKEIKDLVAYLRLLVNPADGEALRRVINVPPRGLGAQTVGLLEEYAELRGAPLIEIVRGAEQDTTLGPRARAALGEFIHLVDDLSLKARQEKEVAPIVEAVIERTNYREHVEKADDKDARARLEVVNEFVASCQQYDADAPRGLAEYLQDMALVADVDAWDPGQPAVTLMTCHSAKGLEFDHIYLLGLEEGLLPHGSALDSPEAIEEERRLCYVAMTRARRTLTLCYARKRMLYGETTRRDASRFVGEIPPATLQLVDAGEAEEEVFDQTPARLSSKPSRKTTTRPVPPKADAGVLATGTKVRHAKFGVGTVLYTSGSGKKQKARIRFESGRPRDFIIAMAPLEILEGK